ncbi:ferric reduction oxidase 8, mitochondrial-like isoform X2 [Aristolochia californica]|uniref:ferric reduction oxidase 8, mitochondrial-like isoform X2 n=1 Tax=Aristolochia californica TaxID=171875 RepID=UPI0035E389B5
MATIATFSSVAATLRLLMVLILGGWVCVWVLQPTELWKKWWHGAEDKVSSTVFGYYGLHFTIFSLPIIVLAILGFAYLHFFNRLLRNRQHMISVSKFSAPIIPRSPLGVISTAELLTAALFITFLAWTFYSRLSGDLEKMIPIKSLRLNKLQFRVMKVGTRLGSLAEACLVLLLLPVLRRLSLFQLLGLQFETSVRYHIWVGNTMMLIATFHGLITLIVWSLKHKLKYELVHWQKTGRVNIAGAITLVIGLIIWITSIPQVRRRKFEFFYYTHHLYILFLIFFLFHAGDRHFYTLFASVLLFALDKILRIVQSTQVTSIISARLLPCKAVELTFPKLPNLSYTPSSIIFIKISTLSRLQWHPFSICSCSTVDNNKISVIIKSQGQWTNDLYNLIEAQLESDGGKKTCLPVAVEGPYGPPSIFYQRYDSLLLIAGGIGITPFLSILQEVSARNSNNKKKLRTKVQLIHVVKKCQDLSMLSPVIPLLLNKSDEQNYIKLQAYVTQEENTGSTVRELLQDLSPGQTIFLDIKSSNYTMATPESFLLLAVITGISLVIFLISSGCLYHGFLGQEKRNTKKKNPSWVSDLLLISSLLITIVCATMLAIFLTRRRKKEIDSVPLEQTKEKTGPHSKEAQDSSIEEHEINFKQRPNFEDVFSKFQTQTGRIHVGVLVCGPESMQESVAAVCRRYSSCNFRTNAKTKRSSFSFHSLSFAL